MTKTLGNDAVAVGVAEAEPKRASHQGLQKMVHEFQLQNYLIPRYLWHLRLGRTCLWTSHYSFFHLV